jgi:hypothetical protein
MEKCKHFLKQYHQSPKTKHTAQTYNMTVNHRRQILHTTNGHPARWNDKTIILFDDFVRGINEGQLLQDVEFELLEIDQYGNEVKVRYRGAWVLADNGYLNWATTIPPFKSTTSLKEYHWSEWLESMRKDVECTFGILKGCWRILKNGVRVHGHEATDMVWKTCCALHNWLLEVDGLNEKWQDGVSSPWEGELGQFEEEDIQLIPENIRRRLTPDELRMYDSSDWNLEASHECNGDNDDEVEDLDPTIEEPLPPDGQVRHVRKLTRDQFRSCLVDHFDILFRKNQIQWPCRVTAKQPTMPSQYE